MILDRLPIESARPLALLAAIRVALVVVALAAVAAMGFPHGGALAAVLAGFALPYSLALLVLALRSPGVAIHPLHSAGDLAILIATEAIVPEIFPAMRFLALFAIGAHAHIQAEGRGLVIAVAWIAGLDAPLPFTGLPIERDLFLTMEACFVAAALSTAFVVGRLRTAESAGRMRAQELSRRGLEAEDAIRRRVAESIHDGPIQELASVEMMIGGAVRAAARGESARTVEILEEAHALVERNVETLRDELVSLGPYAFEELGFRGAIERCLPTWERRFGFDVQLHIAEDELPPEVAGGLFGIAQEAVVNAGRHAGARRVVITLRHSKAQFELSVADDGRGLGDTDPLGEREPGHIGLASMRQRAEVLGGRLEIGSDGGGTRVVARVPTRPRARPGDRGSGTSHLRA